MKSAVLLLLLSPMALAAACPTGQAKNEATLVQIEHTWAQALEKHDADALSCVLAEEFEDVDAEGKLVDRAATLAKAAPGRRVQYQLSDLRAHLYGDLAFVRGFAEGTNLDTKASARVRFTDIYVFRDGRWQCVAGQESIVPSVSH